MRFRVGEIRRIEATGEISPLVQPDWQFAPCFVELRREDRKRIHDVLGDAVNVKMELVLAAPPL